jgi:hypothetical protein
MKFMSITRSSPLVEPELLIRLIMKQLSETNEPDTTEPSPVLIALTLAAASHDKEFHDRLKELVYSSSDNAEEILGMSRDLFMPALGQTADDQAVDQERSLPDEQSCRRVLSYALGEAKRILDEKDFEFLRVFKVLTRAGLLCYSFRLCQFESACATVQDDPENVVRKGVEIIKAALGSPQDEN